MGLFTDMMDEKHPDPLEDSVKAIRKWQRHDLLRQFGENGQVLPENLELSGHIDRLTRRAMPICAPPVEL